MSQTPDMPDEDVDRICDGLVQNAAKVRFLKSLGLHVDRRPNGRPLVSRAEWDARYLKPMPTEPANSAPANGPRWKKAIGV